MEFRFEVTLFIEADNVVEAERIYRQGNWDIDGHTIFAYTESGEEIEVPVPDPDAEEEGE